MAMLSPDARRAKLAEHIAGLRLDLDAERRLAAQAGVNLRIWRNATLARPISADAHMAICAVLFIDPVSLHALATFAPWLGPACWATLGAGVRVARHLNGHSVREAASTAGVSAATVSRCENGRALSFDALARLASYVGQHPHAYTARPFPPPGSTGNTHCNTLKTQEALP
ncbi:helix-turn-helix domain-containing protein [Ancylobacter sp. VNQ12]|uniref:helix-turn-helix domain-containing protein n=1 Tax=Ancylobacter sp. VNQ12 TaxID=3400920 RepID=UPI003C0972E7